MVKLDYTPKTLDNKIIRDGLCGVSALAGDPFSKGLYYVVGGVATQSYLPTTCRRGTCDIDLAVLMRLNKEDFRRFSKSTREYLSDHGYEVSDRKSQSAFCLQFQNKEGEMSYIEFPRFSEKRFEEKKSSLERELRNSKKKIIEGAIKSYIVSSPEDIIVPKFMRSVNSLKRNPNFEYHTSSMKNLTDQEIQENLEYIAELREEAMLNPGDLERSELLRFVSDLYDIRLLSELSGINQAYFYESVKSWDSLREPCYERDSVARSVLPSDFLEHDFTW